jgi:pimeloyl-ACP methyl ester carboxylesterase
MSAVAAPAMPVATPDGSADAAPAPEDANVRAPIAHLLGQRPPAPPWFVDAIEMRPERRFVESGGAKIEALTWGDPGAPGMLFLHGNGAHADWWSFIAPFFAETRRCTAMSWSGMGRSDWRPAYDFPTFEAEALAVAEATGLFDGPSKPVVVAHSFGGGVAAFMASRIGERFAGVIVLDAGVRPPEKRWKGPPRGAVPNRVYPTLEAALARFRLAPAQRCENLYLLDYIARESLRPAPLDPERPDGEQGWTWRFDPYIWSKMTWRAGQRDQEKELASARCPIAFVHGERSFIMDAETAAYTRRHAPPGTPVFAMPQADHHLLLDQPLALVSTLRALLEGWAKV